MEKTIQKIKDFICKFFGHRWTYYLINKKHDVRVCCYCGRMQEWKWHMTCMIWSWSTMYWDKGAKENCNGYGEK